MVSYAPIKEKKVCRYNNTKRRSPCTYPPMEQTAPPTQPRYIYDEIPGGSGKSFSWQPATKSQESIFHHLQRKPHDPHDDETDEDIDVDLEQATALQHPHDNHDPNDLLTKLSSYLQSLPSSSTTLVATSEIATPTRPKRNTKKKHLLVRHRMTKHARKAHPK